MPDDRVWLCHEARSSHPNWQDSGFDWPPKSVEYSFSQRYQSDYKYLRITGEVGQYVVGETYEFDVEWYVPEPVGDPEKYPRIASQDASQR